METTPLKNSLPNKLPLQTALGRQPAPHALALLESEYRRRRQKNSNYSIRAFAAFLGLSAGRLSEIFNGKRPLTEQTADRLLVRLGYSPEQRSKVLKKNSSAEWKQTHVSEDVFQTIADWQHFAIMSLLRTDNFDPAPKAIAARLGISIVEARSALTRLERLGLIVRDGETLTRTTVDLATSHGVESGALRQSHKQSLEQSIQCLQDVPLTLRDITSQTMAIDPALLPLAKVEIVKFHQAMGALLECGKKTEVYNLNIQLVPVTKISKKERSTYAN